jgi:hypothetical protein
MNKILILAALFFSAALSSYAQNDADVQRYTANYFSGTARFQAMGGAFGALGGDMSSIHINPASVGVYRFGEISFTPAYEFNTINGVTEDMSREEAKQKLVVNNVGFVLANELNNPKWKSVNFSVSYNRINTFNDITRLTGQYPAIEGLAGDFLVSAQGLSINQLNDFGNGLAWDAVVINNQNFDDDDNFIDDGFYRVSFDPEEQVELTQTAERDGRLSETALTLGANYDDRLYIGFGLGFRDVYYESEIITEENTVGPPAADLLGYTFTERLQSEGLGVNASLGVIYKWDNLRFGASVRTPTVFAMTDNFSSRIQSRFQNPSEVFEFRSDAGFFEYRIRTPWHFMGSIAGVLGKKAIFSAQYERIDFSGGELRNASSGADADFSETNQDIAQFYTASNIFRVGGEYRFTKSFSARAGFAYFSNPLPTNEQGTSESLDRQQINFGLGYRLASWYVDLSYSRSAFNERYFYTELNEATLENTQSIFAITVGLRM